MPRQLVKDNRQSTRKSTNVDGQFSFAQFGTDARYLDVMILIRLANLDDVKFEIFKPLVCTLIMFRVVELVTTALQIYTGCKKSGKCL